MSVKRYEPPKGSDDPGICENGRYVLFADYEALAKQNQRLTNKISHGCTDAACPECDGDV